MFRLAVPAQGFDERPDRKIAEDGMAEVAARVDLVVVSAPDFGARYVSVGDELGEDPLRGPFGDSDVLGDVTRTDLGVTCDAKEHVRVVGEEAPGARWSRCGLRLLRRHRLRSPCSDWFIAKVQTRKL
jgi:hypothetical protein